MTRAEWLALWRREDPLAVWDGEMPSEPIEAEMSLEEWRARNSGDGPGEEAMLTRMRMFPKVAWVGVKRAYIVDEHGLWVMPGAHLVGSRQEGPTMGGWVAMHQQAGHRVTRTEGPEQWVMGRCSCDTIYVRQAVSD